MIKFILKNIKLIILVNFYLTMSTLIDISEQIEYTTNVNLDTLKVEFNIKGINDQNKILL